ncbi:NUDIX domain-containing protein [Kitasatospora sp. NPDC057936]|uniref:NUDIX domain-containing protein n=1 Tax=Kitasatospora sp. NPDC057936 TaxID=3346283 RepID=UPI0036D7D3E3
MHNKVQQQPARRIGALVLIRDGKKRILLEDTTYRKGLQLPGGAVHKGEQVADAAARELAEETGMRRVIAFHLGVDQIPANPNTGSPEGFNFICDGGFASHAEVAGLSIPVGASEEIRALAWVHPDELDNHVEPYMAARIRIAVDHADSGLRQPLLYIGQPADQRHGA